MIDDLRSDDGLGGLSGPARQTRTPAGEQRPMADREVPLGQMETESRILAATVHAWLDGELPEASVRRGETARDVDFWKQLNDESERRRRMTTPLYLETRIMQSLPQTVPAIITPWYRREFVITPTAAVSTVVAVAALSAIVTAVLFTIR
jgi:hypothetical protein